LPHEGEFPGFAALGIAFGGLGFEVGEGDPGEGVGGLIEGGFLGFVVEQFGGAEFKGVAGEGGGEFAGGGSPRGAVVARSSRRGRVYRRSGCLGGLWGRFVRVLCPKIDRSLWVVLFSDLQKVIH
jgi:hypothetical protein